jgi:hypothetical protein
MRKDPMAGWLPYAITFRVARTRKVRTWIRFAPNAEHATDAAHRALVEEFLGAANLISVDRRYHAINAQGHDVFMTVPE